jgi:hypothetical protein
VGITPIETVPFTWFDQPLDKERIDLLSLKIALALLMISLASKVGTKGFALRSNKVIFNSSSSFCTCILKLGCETQQKSAALEKL